MNSKGKMNLSTQNGLLYYYCYLKIEVIEDKNKRFLRRQCKSMDAPLFRRQTVEKHGHTATICSIF